MRRKLMTLTAAATVIVPAAMACAGGHTWDVVEVFSTPDGLIQFIELREMAGTPNETGLNGRHVRAQPTGGDFIFPANVAAPTSGKSILLATQSFADLANAPTPDHIIAPNFFNPAGGDTFTYHTLDTWVVNSGQIPQDCMNSWNRAGASGVAAAPTPRNYAGAVPAGPIDYCPEEPVCPADLNNAGGTGPDGVVDVFDLFVVLSNWNTNGPGADLAPDNSIVDVFDLFVLLDAWGPCK